MWSLSWVSDCYLTISASEVLSSFSTGAKGSAKPKKCVDCDGKGFTIVHTQVNIINSLPPRLVLIIFYRYRHLAWVLRELCALPVMEMARS